MSRDLPPAYQALKVTAYPQQEAGRYRFGADQGKATYNVFCASCHGLAGAGGANAPSLVAEARGKDLGEVIRWIKNPAPPMPKLSPPLTDGEVDAVARYIEGLR